MYLTLSAFVPAGAACDGHVARCRTAEDDRRLGGDLAATERVGGDARVLARQRHGCAHRALVPNPAPVLQERAREHNLVTQRGPCAAKTNLAVLQIGSGAQMAPPVSSAPASRLRPAFAVSGHDAGMVALAAGFRAPFPRLWLSGFLSDFGDGVRLAAFPLLAVHFTRSPTAVAAVTAVQGLPWLVLGAGAGVFVDRADRRRVMVIMSIVQAVMIAALAVAILAHSAGLLLIYLTAFVTGVAAGLHGTAASASVPGLVKPADLDQANGQLIASRIVGTELARPGRWRLAVRPGRCPAVRG